MCVCVVSGVGCKGVGKTRVATCLSSSTLSLYSTVMRMAERRPSADLRS